MKKIDFVYYVIEKANVKVTQARAERVVKDISKKWQMEAEKFLESNNREIDYKFVWSLMLGGNCR